MSDNSDEPITVPMDDDQTPAAAVIASIKANRGTLDRTSVSAGRVTGMSYNTGTGEFSYHNKEEAQRAEQPAEPNPIDDGIDILASFKTLTDTAVAEGKKLDEFTFDPATGEKQFALTGEARKLQEMKVGTLLQRVEYQEGVYSRALEARSVRDAANARAADAKAIEQTWIAGDPERQKVLDRAKLEAEARHVADASLRAKLGNLGQ